MERRGDLLNQLAIISDLIEKSNLLSKSNVIIFELNDDEYEKTYNYIQKKYGNQRREKVSDTFTVKIGEVDIIFNKSSV